LEEIIRNKTAMLSHHNQTKEEEERQANLWRLIRHSKKNSRSVLDNKYIIIKTIGTGRYAK
jgi:hypothetical protein